MTNAEKVKAMEKAYNSRDGKRCGSCCNCQYSDFDPRKRVCLAFGDVDYTDCSWDTSSKACGLYNRPFCGLKPVRRPIVELYVTKRTKKEKDNSQIAFFHVNYDEDETVFGWS